MKKMKKMRTKTLQHSYRSPTPLHIQQEPMVSTKTPVRPYEVDLAYRTLHRDRRRTVGVLRNALSPHPPVRSHNLKHSLHPLALHLRVQRPLQPPAIAMFLVILQMQPCKPGRLALFRLIRLRHFKPRDFPLDVDRVEKAAMERLAWAPASLT